MSAEKPSNKDRPWLKSVGTSLAGFLGVLAFTVSTYGVFIQRDQALAQRQQVRAMVWPRLQWDRTAAPTGSLTCWKTVESARRRFAARAFFITTNRSVAGSSSYMRRTQLRAFPCRSSSTFQMSTLKGHVLGAGRELIVFGVTDDASAELVANVADHVTCTRLATARS